MAKKKPQTIAADALEAAGQVPAQYGIAHVPWDDKVHVEVKTGRPAHTGYSDGTLRRTDAVFTEDPIFSGHTPIPKTFIGKGGDIDGRTLHITTTVTNLNAGSNTLTREIRITSGPNNTERLVINSPAVNVEAQGDSVVFDDFVVLIATM
jgi:hypothetical protein